CQPAAGEAAAGSDAVHRGGHPTGPVPPCPSADTGCFPGDFGPQPPHPNPVLTECQRDAATGKYAAALSGFIRWLAPQYEAVRGRLRAETAELREQVRAAGQHARTPGIVADLALGLRYFLDFARGVGAVSEKERAELWQQAREALAEAA